MRAERGLMRRGGFVGATAGDVRDIMVDGESGILAISPPWFRPEYQPSKRRLTWPNGATVELFSGEEAERLRGRNIDTAWCDELASWEDLEESWRNLEGRMRLGARPQVCVTTTPKPLALLREIAAEPTTRTTRGSSRANLANVAGRYKRLIKKYEGTERGRQEIDGEILDDREGAMFSESWFRRLSAAPELVRVVVGVDPAVSQNKHSDETGIIAAGVDAAGTVYVLDDASGKLSPEGWAARVIGVYDDHMADVVVAETNRGGDLVPSTIRSALKAQRRPPLEVTVKTVHASRGKATRAEPVAALYEQGRVFHVGPAEHFRTLEKQMVDWDPTRKVSPDRVDALVWAVTFLALGEERDGRVEELPGPAARLDPMAQREEHAAPVEHVGGGWIDDVAGRFL